MGGVLKFLTGPGRQFVSSQAELFVLSNVERRSLRAEVINPSVR